MNLRQLRYVLAIADAGSVTGGADRLSVAQPSLSQQLRRLEQELGGPLFERLPGGVRLTAAGKAFLPEARAAVAHADRATRDARGALGLTAGELEVATVTSIAFGVLPPAFRDLHARYPGTTIALREYGNRRALDEAVRQGAGDVAVGPCPARWRGPVVELGWEQLVAVLPPADPLAASGRPVPLARLAERDWVLFGPDHGLTELIVSVCAGAGFTPRRTVQTSQSAAAAHLVAAGLGVTIVPESILPDGLDAAVRPLASPLVRQLVAFTRQEWSPLALAFLDILRTQPWHRRPARATVIP